ncbi:MAG: HNH endonuclease [Taibaiella sp.]|jgi:5-methylcytosine-specific restriction protein A
MANWIISANSQMYDHTSSFEHFSFIDWRQGNANFEIGDIVFIYSTRPISMIQYQCVVEKINLYYPDIRDDKEYWKNEKEYQKSLYGKFMRLKLIDQIYNQKLSLDNLKLNGLGAAPQGPVKIKSNLLKYITSNFSDNYQTEIFPEMLDNETIQFEGIKKQILVNKYERSSIARKKCIELHGLNCKVCGLKFSEKYGDIGNEFIHIHHLKAIHTIGKEYKVDYKNDLIPVCPNCHSMLHRKINGIEPTIEEPKEMINKNYRN